MKKFLVSFSLVAAAATALAGSQTVKLSVAGMTCAACPITVKIALTKVGGVSKAEVNYEKREAVVTFDEAKTSVQKLAKASADAGFPATVKQ